MVAAVTVAAAELRRLRSGGHRVAGLVVDPARVATSFRSERHFTIDGEPPRAFAELSGFWPTAQGWIRTHANYPHHRARLLRALDLPDTADGNAAAARMLEIPASEIEEALVAVGGVGAEVLQAAEFVRRHPVGSPLPLARVRKTGEAPARAVPVSDPLPAAGLRVLDLTRVIAGPVCTRTLALFGAQVLRIDPPGMPEIEWQHLDTGQRKRSAQLDLTDPAGAARLADLLAAADVLVTGYRPGALDRLGLDPAHLAERYPGLVIARLSAWGDEGDLQGRRGFDSIVQAASGIAVIESPDGDRPGALPAQALDHSAGYLLAAGVLNLVRRQRQEGGTWLVETSLRAIGDHLIGQGTGSRIDADYTPTTEQRRSDVGLLHYALPAVTSAGAPPDYAEVGRPWGRDPASW